MHWVNTHLETLRDGLDGAASPLSGNRLPRDCVVDVRGDVKLQQLRELLQNVLGGAAAVHVAQLHIGLHDV